MKSLLARLWDVAPIGIAFGLVINWDGPPVVPLALLLMSALLLLLLGEDLCHRRTIKQIEEAAQQDRLARRLREVGQCNDLDPRVPCHESDKTGS